MRTATNYKQFTATSSDSTAITATATSAAVAGSHTIEATQLAKAANTTSGGAVTKSLESTLDIGSFTFTNNDFNISLNGIISNSSLV